MTNPAEPDDVDDEPVDDEPEQENPAPNRGAGWSPPRVVDDAAGFLLGLLVWGWIVLPFIQGGPAKVGAVWRAKFLNQAPDGSPLP